jgi:hypothetical protein
MHHLKRLTILCLILICTPIAAFAQKDTTAASDSFFLLKYKGLLGKLARSIIVDTAEENGNGRELQRNDKKYQRYRGRVIRNIEIIRIRFGTPINDTGTVINNTLISLANKFHRQTRPYVVRNNLFFNEKERLKPYLIADNERHLRDLDYLGDAKITVRPVKGTRDSVDVIVYTKDVLSIGGSLSVSSVERTKASVREDNFAGWGDRLVVHGLFDQDRRYKFGYGAEYTRRNIEGTFIDGVIGFRDFFPTLIANLDEESTVYMQLVKPLVNPYMRWTYALDAGYHTTRNMYLTDSLYEMDYRYRYFNVDAWGGYNTAVSSKSAKVEDERLRTLLGARVIYQRFLRVPTKYEEQYFFKYADLTAVLASMSIYRQDFYRTQYIYGFGRSEDVPEGLDVSIVSGWTNKQQRIRGYFGLNVQMNYFSKDDNYYNYTFRIGTFKHKSKFEDIDVLLNLEHFSKLRQLGSWKQRFFLNGGITMQFNKLLNEPLLIDSEYGLREFKNDSLFGGDVRATIKAESVFYSRWSFLNFRFAPFVFTNISWINGISNPTINRNLFNSIGAGLRTRNESLIFGTLEFRSYFFPRKNFYNESFRFEFSSNLKFKYNRQQIKRPEFVVIN